MGMFDNDGQKVSAAKGLWLMAFLSLPLSSRKKNNLETVSLKVIIIAFLAL